MTDTPKASRSTNRLIIASLVLLSINTLANIFLMNKAKDDEPESLQTIGRTFEDGTTLETKRKRGESIPSWRKRIREGEELAQEGSQ